MEDIEESIPDTQRMLSPEDQARASLNGILNHLGRAEVRALQRIAESMRSGVSPGAPPAPPPRRPDPVVIVVACPFQTAKVGRVLS